MDDPICNITTEIIEEILDEYPRIQSLDFSKNALESIENLEQSSETLIVLNLSFNKINFQGINCLPKLINLVDLQISNNLIKSLQFSGIN